MTEKTRKRIGSNITQLDVELSKLRVELEERQKLSRLRASLVAQVNKEQVSSLSVTYDDLCDDLSVLEKMQPLSSEPDLAGKILMWEGRKSQVDLRSQKMRIIKLPNGRYVFQKLSRNAWEVVPPFAAEQRKFFRKAKPTADVRVELNSKNDTVITYRD